MAFILGKKIGMSRFFNDDGTVVPVTLIEAGPVTVVETKNKEKHGYEAVKVGLGKTKKNNKPTAGQLKDLPNLRIIREFRGKQGGTDDKLNRGDNIDVTTFNIGDIVKITGVSKAKGFQGVVKRHGFSGMPASHGHHHVLRHGGSIGQRFPQHTLRGMRMAGRMGGEKTTVRGLKVVFVDKENNLMAVRGAVPGRRDTLLKVVKIK